MRLKGLDLNLLVAFDALLETRSVSRAAERMNLSQPAMSAALSRLRAYFGDELLTVSGKRMYPTPFAESLLPHLRETLRSVDGLIAASVTFDPQHSERTFRIVSSDYILAALLAPLIGRLTGTAPGVRFEFITPSEECSAEFREGRIDLFVAPDSFLMSGHPTELLLEERQVVVGWKKNPVFNDGISEEDFMNAAHVSVAIGPRAVPSFADRQLELLGRPRRVEVSVGSFTAVPWLVQETSRIALLHERLALRMRKHFDIAIAEIPFPFPVMREVMQFHASRAEEAGGVWLRNQLHRVADDHLNQE